MKNKDAGLLWVAIFFLSLAVALTAAVWGAP